jgi:hypothetical protein
VPLVPVSPAVSTFRIKLFTAELSAKEISIRRIGEAEDDARGSVPRHRVPARTQRHVSAEVVNDAVVLPHHLIRRQCNLIWPLAVNPAACQLALSPRHLAERSAAAKIFRQIAENLQDHRVFVLAQIGVPLSRKRNGACNLLFAGHSLSAPKSGTRVRAVNRFTRRQTAVNPWKWQRNISRSSPASDTGRLTGHYRTKQEHQSRADLLTAFPSAYFEAVQRRQILTSPSEANLSGRS